MVIRKNEYEGSVSMSAREQVLMNKIENLRRFGIDISNSRFKDNCYDGVYKRCKRISWLF